MTPANEAGSPTGRTVLVMPEPELRNAAYLGRQSGSVVATRLPLGNVILVRLRWSDAARHRSRGDWFDRGTCSRAARNLVARLLALTVLATVSLVIIGIRETTGLLRLATMEKLHERAADTILSDNRIEGRALVQDLIALTRSIPRLARARARLESHLGDIIDGAGLVRLAERELITPLDEEARRLVVAAAKRVSVVTAVSSRAAIDVLLSSALR